MSAVPEGTVGVGWDRAHALGGYPLLHDHRVAGIGLDDDDDHGKPLPPDLLPGDDQCLRGRLQRVVAVGHRQPNPRVPGQPWPTPRPFRPALTHPRIVRVCDSRLTDRRPGPVRAWVVLVSVVTTVPARCFVTTST